MALVYALHAFHAFDGIRHAGSFLFMGLAFGLLGLVKLASFSPPRAGKATTRLSVEGGALVIREGAVKEVRHPIRRYSQGWIVEAGDGGVLLSLEGDFTTSLVAWLPDVASARELLEELGLSPRDRARTFDFFGGLSVTVGLDGIVVAWPILKKRRFVAYDQIAGMTSQDWVIRLELVDGKVYEIATGIGQSRGQHPPELHRELVERIEHARALHAEGERGEAMGILARAGRSTRAWVSELRLMGEGGSHYRSSTVPPDALLRVALDPSLTEEMRVGAALALRVAPGAVAEKGAHLRGLEQGARDQLRVAAEASVSPRVRVALAAAADDVDDDQLVEALGNHRASRGS